MLSAHIDAFARRARPVAPTSIVALAAVLMLALAEPGCADESDSSCSCPANGGHYAKSDAGAKFEILSGVCTGKCVQSSASGCHTFVAEGAHGAACSIKSTPATGTATVVDVSFANTDCCGVLASPSTSRNP